MKFLRLMPLLATALLAACVTHIHATRSSNPPPLQPLSAYRHFQLMPITASAQAAEERAAMVKINENILAKLQPLLASWDRPGDGATLRIEPHVDDLKFVGGVGRAFAGALAGSSAVRMHLRMVDSSNGHMVANPEFFQRAFAMSGTYTFGGSDNAMLVRISTVCRAYLEHNYAHAVGGPTGLESAETP